MELKKKFAVFVLLLILVALAAGGGTYAFLKNKADKEKKDLQTQIDVLKGESTTTETTTSDTADWQTYTNTQDGYSVKYPKNWFAEYSLGKGSPNLQGNDSEHLYISKEKIVPCTDPCAPSPYSMALEIVAEPAAGKALNDVVSEKKLSASIGVKYTEEAMVINDRATVKMISQCEGVGCGNPIWYTIYSNKLYTINSNLAYEAIFDNIVSTITFTDPTAGWKTYAGSNFSFKYPSDWVVADTETPAYKAESTITLNGGDEFVLTLSKFASISEMAGLSDDKVMSIEDYINESYTTEKSNLYEENTLSEISTNKIFKVKRRTAQAIESGHDYFVINNQSVLRLSFNEQNSHFSSEEADYLVKTCQIIN